MDGLLVVDKPAGPTSHDVVARIRRVLGERRVGHTGTLDPAATGVLPLVIGRATRLARFLSARDKTYEAELRLGVATETYDAEGAPVGATHQGAWPSREEIARAIEDFRGTFAQRPPAFSAKRISGRRSYALARAGARPELRQLPAEAVTAHQLDLLSVEDDRVTLRVVCSAGFYVRSLANDLGERLSVGAHLISLRRTHSGDFSLADALPLAVAERDPQAARDAMIPLDRMLGSFRAIVLTAEGARRAAHGLDIGPSDIAEARLMGSACGHTGTQAQSAQRASHQRATAVSRCEAETPTNSSGGGVLGAAAVSEVGTHETVGEDAQFRLLDENGRLLGIGVPAGLPGLLHPSIVLV